MAHHNSRVFVFGFSKLCAPKHVQAAASLLFVRNMVESFELEVLFVRTADNIADMFTKSMKNATEFHKLRRLVMNQA